MEKHRSRPELLEQLLGRHGVAEAAASALSADLVLRHPMARRVGVRRMARTLCDQGLRAEDADGTATLLYALESFDLGRDLQQIRSELRVAGIPDDCAVGAVFEASRLHRECRLATPATDAQPSFATILAVALTAYTVAVSLWLLATT